MKTLKKTLSVLLVGIIAVTSLFCCTVAASAADIPYYGIISGSSTPDKYYVSIGGLTDDEISYLNQYGSHGYMVMLVFNYGKSDQIALSYADMYTEDWTRVNMSMGTYKGYQFEITNASFVTINGKYNRFQLEIDAVNKLRKDVIKAMKNSTECSIRIEQVNGDAGGNYYGLKDMYTVPFHGDGKDPSISEDDIIRDISLLKIEPVESCIYTGKAVKPDVTLKNGDKKLVKDTDYTLSYKNNTKIGKASVTITCKGKYTGTKTLEFSIVPPKTTLTAKKSGGKYALSWKAVKGITKYQIQYSTDGGKTYKSAGKVSAKKTGVSLKLDTGKTYTFRIRSYKTVGGKKYYSGWSKTVTVK